MHPLTPPAPHRSRLAFTALACALLTSCASSPVKAPPPPALSPLSVAARQATIDEASLQQAFAAWVADFSASARAAGICEETLRAALGEVRYLPHVIELDRAQPEFTRTVWDYMDRTVTPQRIAMGRDKLLNP